MVENVGFLEVEMFATAAPRAAVDHVRMSWRNTGRIALVIACLVLALCTEQASIKLGGTHCHKEGIAMVSRCSSLNSVTYYVPWMYSCLLSVGDFISARTR
jgi:hypothetical protein